MEIIQNNEPLPTGGDSRAAGDASAPRISFFCPAYLDEENLPRVVRRGVRALERCASEYEWIIVEDGSPDGAARVADALAAELPCVRAAHHPSNLGHGAALKTGFSLCGLDWAGFCDGDDQYDTRDIALFLPLMESSDIVIGRRTNYPNGPLRRLLSAAFNAALRLLFDEPFHDLGCAFKLFRKDALTMVAPHSDGIFTQCEMVLRGRRAGLRITEVAVPAYPRTSGRSTSISAANMVKMVREMLVLWREFYLK